MSLNHVSMSISKEGTFKCFDWTVREKFESVIRMWDLSRDAAPAECSVRAEATRLDKQSGRRINRAGARNFSHRQWQWRWRWWRGRRLSWLIVSRKPAKCRMIPGRHSADVQITSAEITIDACVKSGPEWQSADQSDLTNEKHTSAPLRLVESIVAGHDFRGLSSLWSDFWLLFER